MFGSLVVCFLASDFVVFAVARFDFSWGNAEYHQETLENLKAAVKSTKKLCAVCPEILKQWFLLLVCYVNKCCCE